MSNLLTASRLRSFRTCNRLHRFEYIDGVRPVRESEALHFGTLIHRGLEAWWQGDLNAALAAMAGEADPFERAKAEEMMRGYDAVYALTRGDFEVIGVELQFTAPLLNVSTLRASRNWLLAGKVDVLARHHGRVTVVEHKTTASDIDDDAAEYWHKLPMDPQISMYVVGAESLGYEVSDCLYDVLRKPGQRPLKATPIESRKFLKGTTILYANQREYDETPEEYTARLRADIAENPRKYFGRKLTPRLDNQLKEFLTDTWQMGRQMRESELSGVAVRNPDACHMYGRECPYFGACANGESLDPSSFRTLKSVHPELNEEEEKNAT